MANLSECGCYQRAHGKLVWNNFTVYMQCYIAQLATDIYAIYIISPANIMHFALLLNIGRAFLQVNVFCSSLLHSGQIFLHPPHCP